jgi:hypothetical protein
MAEWRNLCHATHGDTTGARGAGRARTRCKDEAEGNAALRIGNFP